MKVLFDQGAPAPLRKSLPKHQVKTAFECGWQALSNGDLLSAAENEDFDVLITTDQNLRYQQDLSQRRDCCDLDNKLAAHSTTRAARC